MSGAGTGTPATAATSYATVTQFRAMLTQAPTGAATDALIQGYLDRATAMIDDELGFSFTIYGAATDKDFRLAQASDTLILPAYSAGSITHVYELTAKGTTYEDTEEVLATEYDVLDDATGGTGGSLYRYEGWPAGWYRVTAIWGHGQASADIQQVCLEKAINLYIGAQGGQFSDVVGIDGAGAVGYNRAWTNSQRNTLQQARLAHGQFGFA